MTRQAWPPAARVLPGIFGRVGSTPMAKGGSILDQAPPQAGESAYDVATDPSIPFLLLALAVVALLLAALIAAPGQAAARVKPAAVLRSE
jgi:hypothetical protein